MVYYRSALSLQGGKYIFLEHIAASHYSWIMYIIQRLLNPAWRYLHNGCILTSQVDQEIKKAGFSDVQMNYFIAEPFVKPTPLKPTIGMARTCICGVATK